MPSQNEIIAQQELLAEYRRALQLLLSQVAEQGGEGLAPLALVNGITAARDSIRRTKDILRIWEAAVQNHPDDDPESGPRMIIKEVEPTPYHITDDALVQGQVIGVNAGAITYAEIAGTEEQPSILIGDEERQNLRDLLRAHQSRLQVLEVQQAKFGTHAPPQVVTEIAEIQLKIAAINVRLAVATPPLDRARVRELRAQALKAIARKKWGEAENLLSQALATDLEDHDTWVRLQIVQRHLNTDALYQAIRELREEGDWQAVLVALDDLARQQSDFSDFDGLRVWAEGCRRWEKGYAEARVFRANDDWEMVLVRMNHLAQQLGDVPDPDGLWAWAAAHQRQVELYAKAFFARQRGDWRAVLEHLRVRASLELDAPDPEGLQPWAEQEQQRAALYDAAITALETLLGRFPDETAARAALQQLRDEIGG